MRHVLYNKGVETHLEESGKFTIKHLAGLYLTSDSVELWYGIPLVCCCWIMGCTIAYYNINYARGLKIIFNHNRTIGKKRPQGSKYHQRSSAHRSCKPRLERVHSVVFAIIQFKHHWMDSNSVSTSGLSLERVPPSVCSGCRCKKDAWKKLNSD